MVLTVEDQSPSRKACRFAILSTTNPTWNEPGSNLFLLDYNPATNVPSSITTSNHKLYKLYTIVHFVSHRKHTVALIKP
jgi:hypothetical protein